ncbi:GNAT family N-acetyltransferase [Levilactobacillus suantsaii]|uniref:GNAT family N-acetyltransferase n=1 Tax=Levilactobacillus suantsaii TaxID=2292255 RepID=A0A4Q0VG50_9LACO|nr:GNAT family N-acetyltransferase [Levilactobacillus suantsaii]QMU08249.1 GNAT family N-acetyltransferase [Levilactobacillus suantsaii]RXI76566.1 GNAT family N-acetyltransferase [Levilactobacillus suantsaii]
MKFQLRSFAQLTTAELWAIYHLRTAVFVVEQHCAYQEVDTDDQIAVHLLGLDATGKLVAYARLIPAASDHVQIGRVVVAPSARKGGLGRQLVQEAIAAIRKTWPQTRQIDIEAQAYLQEFYRSLGFQAVSDEYLDTGIPHLDMILPLNLTTN